MKDLRVFCNPSVGREGLDRVLNEDAQESPVPSTRGAETDETILPSVLGVREAVRLKWIAEGPTGTVEGRTHGMSAVCKHFMARLSLPGKRGWRLRLRILFFLWLMIDK